MRPRYWLKKHRAGFRGRLQKMMKCIISGEQQPRADETIDSSESLATRDYSVSGYSSRAAEMEAKVDNSNIEEAESSLRESGYLIHEEARALLGRLEYHKGNFEAALHVFEGIDIAAVTPKMRISISRKCENNRRRSQDDGPPSMSMHAVSLLFEAIFLKAKSLERLGRFSEAANTCKIILDTVESALPEGLPESFTSDCKLQETLNKVVELLPELWKLSGDFQEAIISYRRGLLYPWNLHVETKVKIEREFAIFLLYSGVEASPPNLRWQIDSSFVPRNNIEEAVLLFIILIRKFSLGRIKWDPSILDHLMFALSVSGGLQALAHQVEELLPGIMKRNERYCILALCYYGEGEEILALNLLRNMLNNQQNPDCVLELLLASRICGDNMVFVEEGIGYAQEAIRELSKGCFQKAIIGNCLLGVLLSAKSQLVSSDLERTTIMSKSLEALEAAERTMRERDPYVMYHLSLENAEQRKLDLALYHAKQLLKVEAGSNVRAYVLLARILSAQKRFSDAETVINAALDQVGKWDQEKLLRTKAKLQIAQGQLKKAVETYSTLLAIIQVQAKNPRLGKKFFKKEGPRDRSLEVETWNDLAGVYMNLSQWRDAEVCLVKSKAITPFSASRLYHTGLLHQARGQYQDALKAFQDALNLEPGHVQCLVSMANVLRQHGTQSLPVVRSLLTDALRLDRTDASAWYNLGLVYRADPRASALEAAECFEAAALLEESAPIEPFRGP
ncbi:hypothetical protein SAY87_023637 [Trapa incisa]|uniref:Uncharacterized protein n=1 Tax=Trapa incisa TaxID=236973 RepID=A0AAN7KYX8_9MYRT|nr:hypothetical protein SAY87_023637 [Trapa incisa]